MLRFFAFTPPSYRSKPATAQVAFFENEGVWALTRGVEANNRDRCQEIRRTTDIHYNGYAVNLTEGWKSETW
jgi:hypothetical protein